MDALHQFVGQHSVIERSSGLVEAVAEPGTVIWTGKAACERALVRLEQGFGGAEYLSDTGRHLRDDSPVLLLIPVELYRGVHAEARLAPVARRVAFHGGDGEVGWEAQTVRHHNAGQVLESPDEANPGEIGEGGVQDDEDLGAPEAGSGRDDCAVAAPAEAGAGG